MRPAPQVPPDSFLIGLGSCGWGCLRAGVLWGGGGWPSATYFYFESKSSPLRVILISTAYFPVMPLPLPLAVAAWTTTIAGLSALSGVRIVDVGSIGVKTLFGKLMKEPIDPGLHWVNPLVSVGLVDVRSNTINYLNLPTLTSEGLTVEVDVAVTFRVNKTMAVELYSTVGRDWQSILLHPQVRATIRGAVAGFTSKELYDSEARQSVATMLYEKIKTDMSPRGVVIESVPLRAIHLPTRVRESIENKLRMEQENERMQFVLQKERAEAERKAIEGRGIAEFQRIVSEGISENLLKWKGIETTRDIAESQNSKVIIIGAGSGDGLPIIFNAGG